MKFKYGERVRVVSGFYEGREGKVVDVETGKHSGRDIYTFEEKDTRNKIQRFFSLDFNINRVYVEEELESLDNSENNSGKKPLKFKFRDKVKIVNGFYSGQVGIITNISVSSTSVSYYIETKYERCWIEESQLEKL